MARENNVVEPTPGVDAAARLHSHGEARQQMSVPYFDLKVQYAGLRDEILASLDHVCQSASFVLGDEVAQFEKEFAAYCQTRYCVAVNSGTSALHLALLACGVGPGDEVITSANTFIATAEAISYAGAKPVFVDIDPATANIDPKRIEEAITERTKAIVPVHLYGRPVDFDPIAGIAAQHNLAVIEDACQAHGARHHGKRIGSLGNAAAFSFYPGKNLGAYGEGGALTTNDERIAALARSLRDHGQTRRYYHDYLGYNYRMDGFQGAVLRIKLRKLAEWNARRRELAHLYGELLRDARLDVPRDAKLSESVYHLYIIYADNRDAVRAELLERGVQTGIHYPVPIHLQKAYAKLGYEAGRFPHTERACERTLSLPLYPEMERGHVEYAAAALAEIVGTRSGETGNSGR